MKLAKKQREAVLQWVAAGLQSGEINDRAAAFEPPFTVTRQQVDFYRKTRKVNVAEITQEDQNRSLTTGLAIRANRVDKLQALAEKLEHDLMGDSLWVTDVKSVGSELVYITRFNGSEVNQYRGVLDDIAKEMGERKTNVKLGGDVDNPLEVRHYYIPENGRPHPGHKAGTP